jgi:hypothetical protein
LVLSCAALALVLGHVALFGAEREADEGTAAHIWQVLMVLQVVFVAVFAIIWLPQRPKQALQILALQIAGILLACAPVYLLNL